MTSNHTSNTRYKLLDTVLIGHHGNIDVYCYTCDHAHAVHVVYCKFVNVCEGFIWQNVRPSLNHKNKYPQT